ncbi:hydrophobic protein [Catenulispora sp. NF23]|uniref:Hydrophobic protein n=1 Tax=Catenulispora pinistramenti TaxID=2705254 RepID=A0ABS5KN81_9ACTN|nr:MULTISPECIES: hydrophobic protein [Catenulispora]MBS2532836.1 hydrophobic protein [Catenulispora pinistramenti]MBS2547513.1 hydrophobic protein [Catenulispora pinistramenti]
MAVILLVLLVALVLGGLGFAAHALWVIAVIVFAAWLIGFGIRRGEEAAGGRRRWYGRW